MQTTENRFYVYEHLRSDTGAVFYVGKGTGDRSHRCNRASRSSYWHRIVSKAGGFYVRIVANNVDEELSHLLEIERISQLRSIGIRLCNMTDGGEGTSGWVKTKEWREKVGAAHRGKSVSDETRSKLSAALTGHRHTDVTKMKMSASRLGMQNTLGHRHSDETKLKMSAAHIGNKGRAGQKRSEAEREKVSMAMRGKAQSVMTCQHCGKSGGNAMRRWHFDNCKAKT